MSPSLHNIRTELAIRRQDTDGNGAVVVNDPVSGGFFRLKEAESSIAQQLDGSTPLEVVRQRIQEKFGVALEDGELKKFVEQLSRLGLLEESKRAEPAPPPRKVRGSLLYLRFAAFDPNRLLGWLTPKVRFFFTPSYLILSASLILSAFATTVLEWNEITRAVGNLWRVGAFSLGRVHLFSGSALDVVAHAL